MEVRSVEAIVRALNDANVQYLIVGGLAVAAHGYERLTVDVDLVIGLHRENIIRGLEALKSVDYHMSIPATPEQFADPDQRRAWQNEKGMVVLRMWSNQHRRTPVDVFIYEPFDFEKEHAVALWQSITDQLRAPIVRYETLLTMKETAGRGKDLLDIAALRKLDAYR